MSTRVSAALDRARRGLMSAARGRGVFALYVLATVATTIQQWMLGLTNDYAIFRWSFRNLVAGRDLYVLHAGQAHDLFKYSPTFATLFAPYALLPPIVGLLVWNLTNALALYGALDALLPRRAARIAQLLVLPQVLRAAQSTQSNALVAALVIVAFVALEQGAQPRAALAIAASAAIKIFPLAALVLVVPRDGRRPDRLLRFAAIFVLVSAGLAALPLLVVPWSQLAAQYASWIAHARMEAMSYGASALGVLHDWAGVEASPQWMQLAGTIVLLLPLLRRDRWADPAFRRGLLASALVYMVLFNHKAEQQSYVIALAGIAIWFVAEPATALRVALMATVFFMTSVSSADFIPHAFRAGLSALHRQAWPVALTWLLMQVQLLSGRSAHGRGDAPDAATDSDARPAAAREPAAAR